MNRAVGGEDETTGCEFVEDGLVWCCFRTEHQSLHNLARGVRGLMLDVVEGSISSAMNLQVSLRLAIAGRALCMGPHVTTAS